MTTVDWAGYHPPEADTGRYKIGTIVMVSRDGLHSVDRREDLPQWFPARVCWPPESSMGATYRWYDPFVWFETEIEVWSEKANINYPRNMFWNGNLWDPRNDEWTIKYPTSHKQPWIWPMDVWQEKFGNETMC